MFIMLLMCVFMGAELISGDLKFNSLPLYFSRPLEKSDYIAGKYSILLFYLLFFSLVPGVLLVIFKVIFTGQFSFSIGLLLAILFYPLVVAFFYSSLTLMISSLSPNRKFVWISIFLIYIFSDALGEMLRSIFKNPALALFSIEKNLEQTGCFLFQTKPGIAVAPWLSFVIILSLSFIMLGVLVKRISRSEA